MKLPQCKDFHLIYPKRRHQHKVLVDHANAISDGDARRDYLHRLTLQVNLPGIRSIPYEGTNITGATGLSPAQKETLKSLGAVELEDSFKHSVILQDKPYDF